MARTGHATLYSGGEPTRVKRDPSGRVEPAQKLIDDYAVLKSAAYQCTTVSTRASSAKEETVEVSEFGCKHTSSEYKHIPTCKFPIRGVHIITYSYPVSSDCIVTYRDR